MARYNLLVLLLWVGTFVFSQDRPEREHRIRKSQFPAIQDNMPLIGKEPKRTRYYKEVDGSETTYSFKFRLDRLYYHLDYDPEGDLKNSGFRVKEIDIPSETFENIKKYLNVHFGKTKIKRIFQEYPVAIANDEHRINSLKSTFQNLLLPENTYKIARRGLKEGLKEDYELWFNAEGSFIRMRAALPANYDRILY